MSYLRTGQSARELGVSPLIMRKLCAAGLIEAEQTAREVSGASFFTRSSASGRRGLPPTPQGLDESHRPTVGRDGSGSLDAAPDRERSDRVQSSADDVEVARNQLEKRQIEAAKQLISPSQSCPRGFV